MTAIQRTLVLAAAAVAAVAGLSSGCGPTEPIGEPTTQPTPAPEPQAARPAQPEPLPAKATLRLDQLEPNAPRPVNPDKLPELSPRARQAVEDGQKQLARRQYVAAVRLLERASGYDPANPRVRRLLGLAYLGLPNRGKALQNLTAAVEAAPDDIEAHLLLGRLAATQDQYDKALLHLRTAMNCSGASADNPPATAGDKQVLDSGESLLMEHVSKRAHVGMPVPRQLCIFSPG